MASMPDGGVDRTCNRDYKDRRAVQSLRQNLVVWNLTSKEELAALELYGGSYWPAMSKAIAKKFNLPQEAVDRVFIDGNI